MTQRQLDIVPSPQRIEDFSALKYEKNRVICELTERFSLVVKRDKQCVYVLLRSGSRGIKIPFDIFDAICNAQLSINYLKRWLEETIEQEKKEAAPQWLCSYCGERLVSEAKCLQHEDQEHRPVSVNCFHPNLMECEQCVICNPTLRSLTENLDYVPEM